MDYFPSRGPIYFLDDIVAQATMTWARLHNYNYVPKRPPAKVAPVGRQLATMALTIKTVIIPKGGLHGKSRHPI